jgi:hypothetical protein
MIGIAMVIAWLGYSADFWGYSLIKGWNLSFKDLMSPTAYYKGTWPPPVAGNTVVLPDGTSSSLISTADYQTSNASSSTSGNSPQSSAPGATKNGIQNYDAIQAAVQKIKPEWATGQQWDCLVSVIKRESGGRLTAQNPSSNAYGIAQFINGPSEYATYGGNSVTVLGQMTAMIAYITVRYGTPCGAWNSELTRGYY